jgi:signal transduction histidine kinase
MSSPSQEVLDFLVVQACDLLSADIGQIWLIEDGHLRLKSTNEKLILIEQSAIQISFVEQAINSARPVYADDLQHDNRLEFSEAARKNDWRSVLVVPIINSEYQTAIGALSILTTGSELRDFSDSDWETKVLAILAAYTELAVQHEANQVALRTSQEQRAVAETFAAVGDIAANLLHRLNNRVGTIPVRIEGIREKCKPEIETNQYLLNNLTEIEKSATDAIEFVRDSLFHLRPIQLTAVNVAASVETALAEAEIPPSITVQTYGLTNLPAVKAGAQRLGLVFLNLIENALDAMAGEGRIEIQGEKQSEWVILSVSDSGPGITPEKQEDIFEFNFSGQAGDQPGKLGFGLWWVKTLLTRFGGSVYVESDGRQGTTFTVRLPLFEVK